MNKKNSKRASSANTYPKCAEAMLFHWLVGVSFVPELWEMEKGVVLGWQVFGRKYTWLVFHWGSYSLEMFHASKEFWAHAMIETYTTGKPQLCARGTPIGLLSTILLAESSATQIHELIRQGCLNQMTVKSRLFRTRLSSTNKSATKQEQGYNKVFPSIKALVFHQGSYSL